MTIFRNHIFALAIGVASFGGSDAAHAQSVGEFYRGKTIQLMVGFGTGGEDDL
jgi:hypothetical protein